MATCIIYTTKMGSVTVAAEKLRDKLSDGADLFNIMEEKVTNLANYDTIILGSSIYIGKPQKKMRKFVEKQAEALSGKKLGLFICCGARGGDAKKQLASAYPGLFEKAVSAESFGDAMVWEKAGFIAKAVTKKMRGKEGSFSDFDEEAIARMGKALS